MFCHKPYHNPCAIYICKVALSNARPKRENKESVKLDESFSSDTIVPEAKMEKIRAKLQSALTWTTCTARELARVYGLAMSCLIAMGHSLQLLTGHGQNFGFG